MQFQDEIHFYTEIKSRKQKSLDMYDKIMKSCHPDEMFGKLQKLVDPQPDSDDEGKTPALKVSEMPVRKFFNNTFDARLSRAIFALTKKQTQNPDNVQFFTTEGMIKFVAFQLLDNPPDGEINQEHLADEDSV